MQNEIIEIVNENAIEDTKGKILMNKYNNLFEEAKKLSVEAKDILVKDESDTASMTNARQVRLKLKNIRVETEKVRKELKEDIVREGKAIDGISNIIKAIIVPAEDYLDKQENYIEILKEERKQERLKYRTSELSKYVTDISLYNIVDMPDEVFDQLLNGAKKALEDKQEAERLAKIEEEKIRKEKEEEEKRIREENEKLKSEKEAREKEEAERIEKDRIEKEKVEKEQKEKLEAITREKEEAEKKLKEKEEAERKQKEEAERKVEQERLAQLEDDRQQSLKPEKQKLTDLAIMIKTIEMPKELSVSGMNIVKKIEIKLLELSQEVLEDIKKM